MRPLRPRWCWVFIACIVFLASHVAVGHAHADLLAAIPLQDHVPGDDHHESAGGSCDGVKASAHSAPAPTATSLVSSCVTASERQAVSVETGSPVDRPPLFLLHASLLI
jgi:hypothetical protein